MLIMYCQRIIFNCTRLGQCAQCAGIKEVRWYSRNPKKLTRDRNELIKGKELFKYKLKRFCSFDKNSSSRAFELISPAHLWKPFLFSVSIIGVSFGSAAVIEYERMSLRLKKQRDRIYETWRRSPQTAELIRKWNSLSPSDKVFWSMCLFNFAVLIGLKKFPERVFSYFTSQPFRKPLYSPMFLSMFGHSSFVHLFLNMYALHSVLPAMRFFLGDEQLWALYVSAGVFSSFVSLSNKVFRKAAIPSLGASGAILGVLAAFCVIQPDSRLGIPFIPISFPAKFGLIGLILIDSLGTIRNWRFIDHAAHLGGSFFGIWYMKFGQDILWRYRRKLGKQWYDLKRKFR